MAKVVLDEVQIRLRLLDELKRKVDDNSTDEVQELQPLFKRGLWIFGPEYETIEYTSNEGMTTIIQKLFKQNNTKGSLNRPDFAILPDSTAGFYSYPKYDDDNQNEIGVDRLVIIELKKPTVKISTDEKDQCWKYIRELYNKGLLQRHSKVLCYPLGKTIDPVESDPRSEKDGNVKIQPLSYDTVITRAKSRMLKLFDRVKSAPFFEQNKKELEPFLKASDDLKHDKQLEFFKEGA